MTAKKPDEPILYNPGNINFIWQHEESVFDHQIEDFLGKIYDAIKVAGQLLGITFERETLPVQKLFLGYTNNLASEGDEPDDPHQRVLPVTFFSLELKQMLPAFKSDDIGLEKMANMVIGWVDTFFKASVGTDLCLWLIAAHCLPDYCLRPEGVNPILEIQHGTGGPAAYALAYTGPTKPHNLSICYADKNSALKTKLEGNTGKDVTVAVLDTAFVTLNDAQTAAASFKEHWLYKELLFDEVSAATFSSDSFLTGADNSYYMDETGYDTDGALISWQFHGLSVAGLIRLVAPNVNLKFYRVLNNQGIGSIRSIVNGLLAALSDNATSDKPLIINCSFTISKPPMLPGAPEESYVTSGWQEDLRFIKLIFNALTHNKPNVVFVGAAGNDSYGLTTPLPPSYPASAQRFAAVAALTYNENGAAPSLANYSNSSVDLRSPEGEIGLAVFGGEITPPQDKQLPVTNHNGIVVPYIDPTFYTPSSSGTDPHPTNATGFGYVAGTSFATAIVSGLAACLLSNSSEKANNPIMTLQAAKEDPDTNPNQGVRVTQNVSRVAQ